MDALPKLQKLAITALLCSVSCLLATPSAAKEAAWRRYLKPSFDIGILGGYTGGYRQGVVVNTSTSAYSMQSGAQDSSEVGVQMRLLFGSEYNARPFFYFNSLKSIGTPISILLGRSFAPFTSSVKQTLKTNWISRLGVGGTTPWLYDTFQLGLGAAAAVLNQTLETDINNASFNQRKTSVRPSMMGSVTWSVCPKCVMKHEALITAELTADNNPAINTSITTGGVTVSSYVKQAMVLHGNLVFSVSL